MRPHPSPYRDLPPRPGITLVPGGAEISVYAGHADGVEVCLFEPGDVAGESERRIALPHRVHGHYFGFLPGVGAGQRYALRAHGEWSPQDGLRYNDAKLLLDPYARAIEGEVDYCPAVYGHVVGDDLATVDMQRVSRGNSAPHVPRGVVVEDNFDWGSEAPPRRSWSETVIYETHVRSLTHNAPHVPERLRGTYAGLAFPSTLDYLRRLGVTAVELLPVQAFTSEPFVLRRGLVNHWGYNTLGFFAPHARYAAATDPQDVVNEFKGMVKLMHQAGIEVILDVVYNHTCEQSGDGPTLSWRGLDNRAYYRLDSRGYDIDVTGCGNTLDVRHPVAYQMVLDSLRYWVEEMRVDGFRFDLAVALGRGKNEEYDPDNPFLMALRTDPSLAGVKLIAEPWDLGIHGWRTGQFPPPMSEWNDRFRDRIRSFWLCDLRRDLEGGSAHGVQDLATRLAGSEDVFRSRDRGPLASVNFVAAHDGFTAADLTSYNTKHNEANGEDNRDGSDGNHSWNHGVEGPADDHVAALRRRSMRNLLGTLLLSTGVPMINGGDEFGRTQGGNNNAYCQDSEVSWYPWALEDWQRDLLSTTRFLTSLRAANPVLRQRHFFTGRQIHRDGSKDLEWYGPDGQPMTSTRWADTGLRTLQMLLDGSYFDQPSLLLVVHGSTRATQVTLPSAPRVTAYELLWDSAWEKPRGSSIAALSTGPVTMTPASLRLYRGLESS